MVPGCDRASGLVILVVIWTLASDTEQGILDVQRPIVGTKNKALGAIYISFPLLQMKPPFGISSMMGVINSGYVKELSKRSRNDNPIINSGCVKELYPNLLVMTIPVQCCVSQFPVN